VLTHSFCHIPGISSTVEAKLWDAGVRGWDHLGDLPSLPISPLQRERLSDGVQESRHRLELGDAAWFADGLPSKQHWRLFSHFRSSVAYLDIETTGLSSQSMVTTIALYDGRRIRHYVQGENLDQFGRDVAEYALIVTYNGKCFDVPFLRQSLGLQIPQAHIDLRYVLASLGYKGGLKGCEKKLGLHRGDLEDVDGFFAVLLWQDYLASGNPRSLETLLAYNIQDVVNLETLLVMAYNMKLRQSACLALSEMVMPQQPRNPFVADREVIGRLRERMGPGWDTNNGHTVTLGRRWPGP
jgi:uncharacterized protein YprB with RNaseH-like and TPR domain